MNLETETSMRRSDLSTAPKRSAELEELLIDAEADDEQVQHCLLYTSPSPRDRQKSRMPSSA